MAAKRKTQKVQPPTQTPEYVRGVFDTLVAMRAYGDAGLQQEQVIAVAEELRLPTLFVEAAMAYEAADVDALGEWWAARKGGA